MQGTTEVPSEKLPEDLIMENNLLIPPIPKVEIQNQRHWSSELSLCEPDDL